MSKTLSATPAREPKPARRRGAPKGPSETFTPEEYSTQLGRTEHQYLLVAEVAELAEAPVHSVRAWLRSGRLPSVKLGRRRLVRRADFEAFMASDRLTERKPVGPARDSEGGSDGLPGT